MLARWLRLYELELEEAEETRDGPPELKDFVHFLTGLKRCLEVGRLCDLGEDRGQDEQGDGLDPESLRRVLLEEDSGDG